MALEVGDIVVNKYRCGFFRVEEIYPSEDYEGEDDILVRRVATKGLKLRREKQSYVGCADDFINAHKGIDELTQILNELNPLK